MTLEMRGVEAMAAALKIWNAKAKTAALGALREEAADIMAVSQKFVPVDQGTLKGSKYIDKPVLAGSTATVTMGYGGAAGKYALAVHENPRAGGTHGISPSGQRYRHWAQTGRWKYLEQPILMARKGFLERIGRKIRERFDSAEGAAGRRAVLASNAERDAGAEFEGLGI